MALWGGRARKRTSKLAQKRRKIFQIKCTAVIILAGTFLGFLIWFSYRPQFQLTEVVVKGNEVVTKEAIASVAWEALSGKRYFIFPKTNVFMYPKSNIEGSVLSQFTRVREVELSQDSLQELVIHITEQSPYALWCMNKEFAEPLEDDEVVSVEECYFLNDEGRIFTQAPSFTGNVFFRFYGWVDEGSIIRSTYLGGADAFVRIDSFIEGIKKLGLEGVSMHLLEDSDVEIRMEDGSWILFSLEDSFSKVLENLELALGSDSFVQASETGVEYIDLRFGNKVYIKPVD